MNPNSYTAKLTPEEIELHIAAALKVGNERLELNLSLEDWKHICNALRATQHPTSKEGA